MSTRFDALIAERLGISEEQARKLGRTMLEQIRARAGEEEVGLPELGTFREEEGTLTFSPSPSLRRLVNQEYEGLQPESVPEPTGPDAAEETDDGEPPVPPGPVDEPEPEDEPEARSPWELGAQPSAGEEAEYPVVEEDLRYDAGTAAEAEEEARDDASSGPPADNATSKADAEPESTRTAATSTVDSFQLLVGLLLVIFLIAAGWFVLSQTRVLSPEAGSESGAQAPELTADSVVTETETDPQAGEDTSSAQPARSRGTSPGANDSPDTIDSTAARWTIVVASVPNRSTAEEMRRKYEARFSAAQLPVEIRSETVNGSVRYRVAVGQYSSREAVVQALEEHTTQLPEGAWVLEL